MEKIDLFRKFVREHAGDDPVRLLLAASKYPEVDVPKAVEQIAIRKQLREKLPDWVANEALLFPSKLAAEQCSSWQTAAYKQRFTNSGEQVCDLTGGMGVDSYYLAQRAKHLTYIERYGDYCQAATNNFKALGVSNITVYEGNFADYFEALPTMDLFYVDPARRGNGGRRVYALDDCEPDLTIWLPRLLEKTSRVLAKISPMADLRQSLALLPGTLEVHVLAVRGECKELLFFVGRRPSAQPLPVYCVNFQTDGGEESFSFTLEEEHGAESEMAKALGGYLYEPNAAVLKAGAFKCVGVRFGCKKLQVNSHLYTSDCYLEDFPGRCFSVEEVIPFNNATCKRLSKAIPRANITARNFPLTVEQLRKKSRIAEGGNVYLFATTLADESRVLIRCAKKMRTFAGE